MPQDVISEFYKDVIEPKKYFASEQEFRGILNDAQARTDFFNDVIKPEQIFTDYSEFENTLGLKKKGTEGTPPPQQRVGSVTKLGGVQFGTPSVPSTSKQPSPSGGGDSQLVSGILNKLNKQVSKVNQPTSESVAEVESQMRIDSQRRKLDLLTNENKNKRNRIQIRQEIQPLEQDLSAIKDQIEQIQNQYGNELPPDVYAQYNKLMQVYEPMYKEYEQKYKIINESIEASKLAISSIKSSDASYQKLLESQFDIGKKTKTALLSTRDNIVKSAGRIVETIGDLSLTMHPLGYEIASKLDTDQKITDILGKDIYEYGKNLEKATSETLPKSYKEYSPLSDKFDADKILYFGMNTTAQLAPTVAMAFATGGVGAAATGFSMEFGGLYDTFHEPIKQKYIQQGLSQLDAEKKADLQAGSMASIGATIIGQLDRLGSLGLIDQFTKKVLLRNYAKEVAEQVAKSEGKIFANEIAEKSATKVIKDFTSSFVKTAAPESATEFLQELEAPLQADVYDFITQGNTFKDETLANKQTWINAGNAFIGSLMATSPAGIYSGYKNIANPTNYELAINFRDPDDMKVFEAALMKEVENGVATEEQAQSALKNIQRIQQTDTLIPSTIANPLQRAQSVALLMEKEDIQAEIEGKDKSLVKPQNERINEINANLEKISRGEIIKEQDGTEPRAEQPATPPLVDEGGVVRTITAPQDGGGVIEEGVAEAGIPTEETIKPIENEKEPTKTEDGKPLPEGLSGIRTKAEEREASTELRTEEEEVTPQEGSVVGGDVEVKADIEKRRQEELNIISSAKPNTTGKVHVDVGGGKFELQNFKVAANGRIVFEGQVAPTDVDIIVKEINAKYDAEAKAVEQSLQSTPQAGSLGGGDVEVKADIEKRKQGKDNKIENIVYNNGVFEGSFLDNYEFIAEGSESRVYRSKDGTHVIKISEPYNSKDEILFNSRITNNLLREILGNSGLEVIGYYEHNGVKNPVYKQNYIEGKTLSEKEVASYLKTIKGVIEIDGKFYYKYDSKLYAISDFSDNVIQDKNGNIVPIDLDIYEVTDNKINAKYDAEAKAVEQSPQATPTQEGGENPALKDVESTAKALEDISTDKFTLYEQESTPTARDVDYGGITWQKSGISGFNIASNGKTYITDKDGEIYEISKSKLKQNDTYFITIKDRNGNEVGNFEFLKNNDGSYSSNESYVTKRRKGLASIAYDYLSEEGIVIKPSKKLKKDGVKFWANSISEAYHKAKADDSNPELVKAVEELLEQKPSPSVQVEGQPITSPQTEDFTPQQKEGAKPDFDIDISDIPNKKIVSNANRIRLSKEKTYIEKRSNSLKKLIDCIYG